LAVWKRAAENVNGTIIDCGGYNGIFGLIAAATNPQAQVIIIEPDRVNVQHVQYNVSLNNLKNIVVVRAVASDSKGQTFFQADGGHSGGHIADSGAAVDSVMLDMYTDVSLIKIDIEGAEYKALLGARSCLEKGADILLELHKSYLRRFGFTETDIWNLLKKHGYKKLFLNASALNEEHYWLYKK